MRCQRKKRREDCGNSKTQRAGTKPGHSREHHRGGNPRTAPDNSHHHKGRCSPPVHRRLAMRLQRKRAALNTQPSWYDLLRSSTATATTAARSAATATAATTLSPTALRWSTRTALTSGSHGNRYAIGAVEVNLFAALLATGIIEVVTAFNGNGAGVGRRLPFDRLRSRLTPWTVVGRSSLA